jgi:GDP-L-fucose synthase
MVGSAILRNLQAKGFNNFVTRTFDELDLTRQSDVEAFFEQERPDYVIDAAAKVGGIVANNTYRAQFIYENLMIQNNIIHSAYKYKVKKLLFLGSSCIYPKNAPQPMKEEYLLTAPLEETNEPYAVAKIAGIKMCENYYRQYGCDFISVMPTNLYGPNDNYDLEKSHVLPALIRKFHLGKCLEQNNWPAIRTDLNRRPIENITGNSTEAEITAILQKYLNPGMALFREQSVNLTPLPPLLEGEGESLPPPASCLLLPAITIWGSGTIYREFLHVDDMASACIHIMENVSAEKLYNDLGQTHINIGTGIDCTIMELAQTVKQIVGFQGQIIPDPTKPDGPTRKQLDISLLKKLNWSPTISLHDGISSVYTSYLNS